MKRPAAMYLLLLLTLFTASGASCRSLARNNDPLAPVAFAGPPTLDDVISTTNRNSAAVRQLYSDSATFSTPGVPSLRASLALERPRRFRLRAKLFVPELDVGSNDEIFWMWAKSDPEQSIYFARHDQFGQGPQSYQIPVGVDWLIDAMGLVHLDPAGIHELPASRPDGRIAVRSQLVRSNHAYWRELVLDERHGWILEQRILDGQGRMMAQARCSHHRFYPEAGASLPHRVQVELPSTSLSFQLDVERYRVNELQGDPSQMWSFPYYEGTRPVDISSISRPATAANPSYPSPAQEGHTAYRPRYRGVMAR